MTVLEWIARASRDSERMQLLLNAFVDEFRAGTVERRNAMVAAGRTMTGVSKISHQPWSVISAARAERRRRTG